jgi:CPA1 family monovalent cation:H+ antiporter
MTADRFETLLAQRLILHDLDGFIVGRIRRIHGRRVADLLLELLERRRDTVDTALDGLRLQYPGYAEELERRFIRRTALRLEEREYESLFDDGLIGEELHTALMEELADRRAAAEERPRLDLALRRADLVQQVPVFADLDPPSLRKLSRALTTRHADEGEIILRRDEAARSVYFIASGAVEIESVGEPTQLGRGEMFGQLAILMRRPRRTEVRAIAPSTLLVLDEVRFRRLLDRSPKLREAVRESAEKRGVPLEALREPAALA